MPTAVTIGGVTTRRPRVLAEVDVSALGGRALSVNVLGIVGDFPFLEKAIPEIVASPQQLRSLNPDSADLALLAKLIYSPAIDDRVVGRPSAVYVVNARPSGQAQHVLKDANGNDAMTIKSRIWGQTGNRVTLNVTKVTETGQDTLHFTLNRAGLSETFVMPVDDAATLEDGDILDVYYDGTDATSINLAYDPSTGFLIFQTRAGLAAGAFVPANGTWKWDGTLTVTPSGAPVGADHTLVIDGVNADTGLVDSETITFPDGGGNAPKVSLKSWAAISQLTWTPAVAETATVTGSAFAISTSQFENVSLMAGYINDFAVQGYHCDIVSAKAGAIKLDELDEVISTSILGPSGTLYVRADLWAAINLVNQSALVTAERASGGKAIPVEITSPVNLSGGTEAALATSDYEDALVSIQNSDINTIVLPNSSDAAVHEALRAHCAYMAGAGGNERNGWVAGPVGLTKTQIKTRTRDLNSRHIAFVAQEVQVRLPTGALAYKDPAYLAVILAAMQCSTEVGTPLTRKYPNVLAVRTDSSWDGDIDAEDLLSSGLCFLTNDRVGLRVERSITTYQTDDNPVFSEVSANESLDTCIRDLWQNLDTLLGDAALNTTRTRIYALAKARLRQQVELGIIKAFNESSLNVEDLGDVFRVNVEIAVTEPTNWIIVSAIVTRTPFE